MDKITIKAVKIAWKQIRIFPHKFWERDSLDLIVKSD
jgi:hypothetical protein